jgi:hypothetical protein
MVTVDAGSREYQIFRRCSTQDVREQAGELRFIPVTVEADAVTVDASPVMVTRRGFSSENFCQSFELEKHTGIGERYCRGLAGDCGGRDSDCRGGGSDGRGESCDGRGRV